MNSAVNNAASPRLREEPAPDEGIVIVEREGLLVELIDGDELTVVMSGLLRDPHPETWLPAALATINPRLEADSVERLIIDLRPLDFVNATSYRALVAWIGSLRELSPPVQAVVRLDESRLWQRVAVHTLRITGAETEGHPDTTEAASERGADKK